MLLPADGLRKKIEEQFGVKLPEGRLLQTNTGRTYLFQGELPVYDYDLAGLYIGRMDHELFRPSTDFAQMLEELGADTIELTEAQMKKWMTGFDIEFREKNIAGNRKAKNAKDRKNKKNNKKTDDDDAESGINTNKKRGASEPPASEGSEFPTSDASEPLASDASGAPTSDASELPPSEYIMLRYGHDVLGSAKHKFDSDVHRLINSMPKNRRLPLKFMD